MLSQPLEKELAFFLCTCKVAFERTELFDVIRVTVPSGEIVRIEWKNLGEAGKYASISKCFPGKVTAAILFPEQHNSSISCLFLSVQILA